MSRALLVDRVAGVCTLTLNRPEVLNALTNSLVSELAEVVHRVSDDPKVSVFVIAGSGGSLSSGQDLSEAMKLSAEEFAKSIDSYQELTEVLLGSPYPIVAAIDGYALGGGLELAAACDMRVSGAKAVFGCPEVAAGHLITSGCSYLLPRIVGEGRARELVLLGEPISANEAARIGLVNKLVDAGESLQGAHNLAHHLASKPKASLGRLKKLLRQTMSPGVEHAMQHEIEAFSSIVTTADAKEGLRSFSEKRPPHYVGA